jgi:hypothetical protein
MGDLRGGARSLTRAGGWACGLRCLAGSVTQRVPLRLLPSPAAAGRWRRLLAAAAATARRNPRRPCNAVGGENMAEMEQGVRMPSRSRWDASRHSARCDNRASNAAGLGRWLDEASSERDAQRPPGRPPLNRVAARRARPGRADGGRSTWVVVVVVVVVESTVAPTSPSAPPLASPPRSLSPIDHLTGRRELVFSKSARRRLHHAHARAHAHVHHAHRRIERPDGGPGLACVPASLPVARACLPARRLAASCTSPDCPRVRCARPPRAPKQQQRATQRRRTVCRLPSAVSARAALAR